MKQLQYFAFILLTLACTYLGTPSFAIASDGELWEATVRYKSKMLPSDEQTPQLSKVCQRPAAESEASLFSPMPDKGCKRSKVERRGEAYFFSMTCGETTTEVRTERVDANTIKQLITYRAGPVPMVIDVTGKRIGTCKLNTPTNK
jgi:hypothetical protein